MIFAWLLLAAALGWLPLVDEIVRVPPAAWRTVDIVLRRDPAAIECRYSVVRGGPVMLWLVRRSEVAHFRSGQATRAILVTGYRRSGGFRARPGPGEYAVIVDNRLDARGPAEVRVAVSLVFDGSASGEVRVLPARRRAVVVALSLLFFAAVLYFAARRLGGAFSGRLGR